MTLFTRAFKRWWQADPATHGAALAYYTIFSLAPMFIILVAVLGRIFGEQLVEGKIMGALHSFTGADVYRFVQTLIAYFDNPTNGIIATAVSSVVIIIGALALFSQVARSLEDIWFGLREHAKRKTFVRTKILAVLMVIILGLILLGSLLLGAAAPIVAKLALRPAFAYLAPLFEILNVINTGVAVVYVVILFMLMYKYLPGVPVTWRGAFGGAAVGGLLFFIGRFVLNLYITTTVISSVYGTAGAVIAILVWFYYSAEIFFFGGAVAFSIDQNDKMVQTS